MMGQKIDTQHGFMTIELVVTIFVAALFLMSLYGIFTTVISSNTAAQMRATAGVYVNDTLAVFRDQAILNRSSLNSACGSNPSSVDFLTAPNLGTIPGASVYDQTFADGNFGLPGPTRLQTSVYAPRGCDPQMPMLVQATVTYGKDNEVVKGAIWVK
jgi:hypothetical protein